MMNRWRDISSFARHETDRKPRTMELRCGGLRLCVTRHIHHPGRWLVTGVPGRGEYLLPADIGEDDHQLAREQAQSDMVEALKKIALEWRHLPKPGDL